MKFTKEQIEKAILEFWERMGKQPNVKKISINSGIIGDNFICDCDTHGEFDSYDFVLKKTNKKGSLIVRRP